MTRAGALRRKSHLTNRAHLLVDGNTVDNEFVDDDGAEKYEWTDDSGYDGEHIERPCCDLGNNVSTPVREGLVRWPWLITIQEAEYPISNLSWGPPVLYQSKETLADDKTQVRNVEDPDEIHRVIAQKPERSVRYDPSLHICTVAERDVLQGCCSTCILTIALGPEFSRRPIHHAIKRNCSIAITHLDLVESATLRQVQRACRELRYFEQRQRGFQYYFFPGCNQGSKH
jgi:hypothetical protein